MSNLDLLPAMTDTVGWRPYLGDDLNGNEMYGGLSELRANVQITRSRGATGDQDATGGPAELVNGTVIVLGDRLRQRDMVVLPGGLPKYVDVITDHRHEAAVWCQELTFKDQE